MNPLKRYFGLNKKQVAKVRHPFVYYYKFKVDF